jgi:predicted N-formylglutamate amidohydrolase
LAVNVRSNDRIARLLLDETYLRARSSMNAPLLCHDEPEPARVVNDTGQSVFFLACDHASHRLPRRLGTLGLSPSDRLRHIAWDIGAAEVAGRLARHLDAALVLQNYSRLAIDCNRDPTLASSIPTISENTPIPGNGDLSDASREARIQAIFNPYHRLIAQLLDQREARRQTTVFVSLHSFTPVFNNLRRTWHAGVLFNRDDRLARLMLNLLRGEGDFVVGENEPYRLSDLTDYTVPIHAERRGLPYVEIEMRQDLIAEPEGQQQWALRLARLLPAAWDRMPR